MLKIYSDCKIVIFTKKKLCLKANYYALLLQDLTTRILHEWAPPKPLFTVEFEKIFAICWN
jgi:hypothetical protein